MMSTITCCLWWFIAGLLLGWVLHWLLSRCHNKNQPTETSTYTPPPPPQAAEPAPVAKAANIPAEKPKAPAKPKAKPAAKAVTIDLAAAKAAGFKIKNADDLTVIEGIGPKINDLFKAAGLKTYVDVSKASVSKMRKTLDDGGSRFRIANPETWAKQAKLAANNKWSELKKLQDELSGGVKK